MKTFPKHVVILGGGAAGWLSALYLDRVFNTPQRRTLPITVVESDKTPRIGVGEATLPSLRDFFSFIELDEIEVMKRTCATLKHGIRFEDWSDVGQSYFHPFEGFTGTGPIPSGALWLARRRHGVAGRYQDESGMQSRLAEAGFAPKSLMDDNFKGPMVYGYHLDADLLADYLAEKAVARGCARRVGDVDEVDVRDGVIAGLRTADGQRIEGDFFIDCSGFASLLVEKALGSAYSSFSAWLPCDRAVAIRKPYDNPPVIPPYTIARALDAGWMWQIGLRQRQGLGYVYSSRHIDAQAAEAELRRQGDVPDAIPAKHLAMRVGHFDRAWVSNCVAIGLAGGFVEPLESTGLYFVTAALSLLVRYFPLSGLNSAARDTFNHHLRRRYEEVRDFIVAHYCLSNRRDTAFWRDVTSADAVPPSLKARLTLWSDRAIGPEDIEDKLALFSPVNWQYVLYGMGWEPEAAKTNADYWVGRRDDHLAIFDQALANAKSNLPRHEFWLAGLDDLRTQAS